MSTFSATCDALIEDLLDHVPTLQVDSNNIHRYSTWFPEELTADGARHLAVFPASENFDSANTIGAPLGGHFRVQTFVILVWEPSNFEAERGVTDEEGTAAFLDLYEAILARLYVTANQSMAGSWKQWFQAAQVPDRVGTVRFFRIALQRNDTLSFT